MKFYICNLGCKVNTYESNVMNDLLVKNGFINSDENDSELVIVNTCSVTDVALKKSLKMINHFSRLGKKIVVVGCVTQVNCNLVKDIKNVIVVLGNVGKSHIVDYINKYEETKTAIIDIKNINDVPFETMKLDNFNQTRAFVKVEDGCENFCSYCIIPYTRGSVRSRPMGSVLEEVRTLALNGHKEVVLAGIHTGHYNDNGNTLADLLNLICSVDEIERVRISSIEITELDAKFMDCLKNNEKIVNHIHIPLQCGNDIVLKDMNRKYDINYFINKISQIRKIRPLMNITTDVIVGYPTETDELFNDSINNIKKIKFGKIHVFPYSPREGTVAYSLKDIDSITKKKRVHELLDLSLEFENDFLNNHISKKVSFLKEVYKDGYLVGHTDDYCLVKLKSSNDMNGLIDVKVIDVKYPYLIGEL